ncbi:KAR9-domain-containing protein [Pleurostoma richardsiae]|uniref:KAR9-domain-containing protein n=1 Tax=Pleurostoma richardsiae TaxID=41990 RepID=A0AA38S2D8_9PEZI|nr:KAR9-domain-containing protein [Pleurostoma richardsiae]
MDTHKYRLPDHTNGNGTKVTLDTRREHLERDSRPPPSPDLPPPPLPKDSPPLAASTYQDVDSDPSSYFNPLGLQRPGSIYTISRASFVVQLAQLTSLQLPDAESLSSKIAAIPTAQAASRALIGAAEQIRSWIHKASEVIGGLDSEDDVEWAAAGGREGLEEVEQAIARFEELINVYVSAIEELQLREDIANVPTDDLNKAVVQMESIMEEWAKIRATLQSVKGQVEIAMEWEELWNMVLGDIQNEMDELIRLVFEMEERRHKSVMAIANGEGVDIGDLETIVEETPPAAARLQVNHRFSLPAFPASPSSPGPTISQDDSSLLALFARMQPLRASLDFLPMRLSVFEARAQKAFPTACEELEMRREALDASYKKLEKDAESLRKELGEDRWVLVFRGAGRQAQKMVESVERTVAKLREAIDAGMQLTNQPVMAKKIESYEAKKTHYSPAIERVLSIIDKGVKDRLTVNGEILRLHGELQTRWEDIKVQIKDMDTTLEDLQSEKKNQQLRDSISSMLSNDRSTVGSGAETPGSSPPSSVIMASLGLEPAKSAAKPPRGRGSGSLGSHLPQPATRRAVSATTPSQPSRKPVSRLSSGLASPSREGSATPTATRGGIPRPASTVPGRPRWNGSTNTTDIDTGHNFKPLSATDRSPYARTTPTPVRSVSALTPSSSKLPMRSPLRASSSSPIPEDTPSKPANRLSFRERLASPGPYSQQALSRPRLSSAASMSTLNNRRASLQPSKSSLEDSTSAATRPASSLASSRRTSMLPQPRHKKESSITGRESPQAVAGARAALKKTGSSASTKSNESKDTKPRWRG